MRGLTLIENKKFTPPQDRTSQSENLTLSNREIGASTRNIRVKRNLRLASCLLQRIEACWSQSIIKDSVVFFSERVQVLAESACEDRFSNCREDVCEDLEYHLGVQANGEWANQSLDGIDVKIMAYCLRNNGDIRPEILQIDARRGETVVVYFAFCHNTSQERQCEWTLRCLINRKFKKKGSRYIPSHFQSGQLQRTQMWVSKNLMKGGESILPTPTRWPDWIWNVRLWRTRGPVYKYTGPLLRLEEMDGV